MPPRKKTSEGMTFSFASPKKTYSKKNQKTPK